MRKNKILQLLAENRAAPRQFTVQASTDADEVTIYLYDVIVNDSYWGGVSDLDFARALSEITAGTIHLRVNSPGGDVFAGRAMEALLRGHSARVIVHIDGVAASAASFLIMGADEIEIADGAMVMIHKGWTLAIGNENDMRATADLLQKVDGTIVKTYADRTGQDPEQLAAWMAAETWMTSDEAVERGFADRKADYSAGTNAKAWNLAAYANAPKPSVQQIQPNQQDSNASPTNSMTADPDRDALRRSMQVRLLTASA